jgi:hypothetical protein
VFTWKVQWRLGKINKCDPSCLCHSFYSTETQHVASPWSLHSLITSFCLYRIILQEWKFLQKPEVTVTEVEMPFSGGKWHVSLPCSMRWLHSKPISCQRDDVEVRGLVLRQLSDLRKPHIIGAKGTSSTGLTNEHNVTDGPLGWHHRPSTLSTSCKKEMHSICLLWLGNFTYNVLKVYPCCGIR